MPRKMAVTGRIMCLSTTGIYPNFVAGGNVSYNPLKGRMCSSPAKITVNMIPETQFGMEDKGDKETTNRSTTLPFFLERLRATKTLAKNRIIFVAPARSNVYGTRLKTINVTGSALEDKKRSTPIR